MLQYCTSYVTGHMSHVRISKVRKHQTKHTKHHSIPLVLLLVTLAMAIISNTSKGKQIPTQYAAHTTIVQFALH